MVRYGEIPDKRAREIVLLQGRPCAWGRCAFCDYILDNQPDDRAAEAVNRAALSQVTGKYRALEVINSGSIFELSPATLELVRTVVREKRIERLYVESHWMYRHRLGEMESFFGVPVVFKCGIETFDSEFRNRVLKKGIVFRDPAEVRRYFPSVCLLVGIQGQTREMVARDIEILLSTFALGCINIFCENSTPLRRDEELVRWFCDTYRHLERDPRIDLLIENTDFGVGA